MEVGAANGRTGHFDNDIGAFDLCGLECLNDLDAVLSIPHQCLHHLARGIRILRWVFGGIAEVLFGRGFTAVADDLLDHGCCL